MSSRYVVARARRALVLAPILAMALAPPTAVVAEPLFDNLADDPASGLVYQRARSERFAVLQAIREASLITPIAPGFSLAIPQMTGGLPGVALLDHDGDGDLDIYVTNGPGAANSLFSSQLAESGALTFVDRGAASGAGAAAQDSSGVCFGDLDNDGDPDLVVLGLGEPNKLFENLGAGAFAERAGSIIAQGALGSVSCSIGDIDGDGLLDVAVANVFDFDAPPDPFGPLFPSFHANQLYRNLGGLAFEDVSASSGLRDLAGLPPGAGGRTVTWAIALVDVDRDGDADVVTADDQGPVPVAFRGGLDIGYLHVLRNDGTGQLTDAPVINHPFSAGSWMGLSFGDLDCDGALDMLASNFGDYGLPLLGFPYTLEEQATRWLLGDGAGGFSEPGLGATISSAFGWGNAVSDVDNDGDPDLVYFGGMDVSTLLLADNPGVVLLNDGCSASFGYAPDALRGAYVRRNVRGAAAGDLDGDGFVDLVTASNLGVPAFFPLLPMGPLYGSAFDATALFTSVFAPTPAGLVWTGLDFELGTVTVERNRAASGNRWAAVRTLGAVGLTPAGRVNRDGIGAVVTMTPAGGASVMVPVVGGSSHLSQHALEASFGLGQAEHGTVEVLWPGGVRNRLYRVRHGERVRFPEIPCGFDAPWPNPGAYLRCVGDALRDLEDAGAIDRRARIRFFLSAMRAFFEG